MWSRRAVGTLRESVRTTQRSTVRYATSTARSGGSGSGSSANRTAVAVGASLAFSTYLYCNRVYLDSANRPDILDETAPDSIHPAHPDKPQAAAAADTQSSGSKSGQVKISDVLSKKDGEEVWVVIKGHVYNMTEWLEDHPGGAEIIMSNRSKDVTPIFNPRHPSDQLDDENLPPTVYHLGTLDTESATEEEKAAIRLKVSAEEEEEDERIARERKEMEERGLGVIVNMRDFEKFAEPMLSKVALAYYASAGDDEITKNQNAEAYQKIHFRPRILRKVALADAKTTILGKESKIPVFISPAAMAKLGHPDGEVNLTKGAASTGIIQVISSNASCSLDELSAVREPGQPLFFQLYVNRKRDVAAELLKKVNNLKMDAIFMTGDAPVGGKRERDMRLKGEFEGPAGGVSEKSEESQGVSQAMFAGVDPDLHWDDIDWIKSQSKLPIIVKGVQCVEDAIQAYQRGADGILISNHGGRQLDTTRASIDVLLEIRKYAPHLLRPQFRAPTGPSAASLSDVERLTPADKTSEKQSRPFEIYVDGGIYRGTDVVKALCLGANAVGVGRGFLFAQSVAGTEGVKHAVGILESEILLALRLLGANKLEDLRPSMVEVRDHPGV